MFAHVAYFLVFERENIRRDKKPRAKESRTVKKRPQAENSEKRNVKIPKHSDSQAASNDAPKSSRVESKSGETKKVLER